VFAQDSTDIMNNYQLDEITIVSDKLNTKLKDVSTKIEIITEKEIESINGSRLPDILKTKSNMFLKSYGLTPALNTISTNGLGAEHTLIIVDGVKLNSFQNSHIDLSLIPKESIERIEIINNGVSSIYGSDAIGGVINIVLKNKELLAESRTTKFDASISQGSFNTTGYSLGVYKEVGAFNARLNFSKEKSDGNFEYYFNNGIEKELKERENSAYLIYDLGFSAQYILNEKNLIKLFSTYSNQDKEVPGIETGTTPAPTNQYDKIWNNILSIENKLGKDFLLKTNLNFQNNFTDYSVGKFLNSTYKNLVYSGTNELRFKKENYGFTTGYSFTHATLESNELLSGIKRNQHALFMSSFYNLNKSIIIYPSARYDYISDISEGTYTYKIGLNYQPISQNSFSIRGNAGKNFRAPSFNDLYWKNSGNENLKPEKSFNIEGGVFYSFLSFVNGQIDFTYTYISAENKIVWTPQSSGLWAPQNIAESVSKNYSFNFNAEIRILEDLIANLNSGLQFTNTKKISSSYLNDPSENKFVPYIPLQSANLNFGVSYKDLEINLFYSYSGNRYSDFSNNNKLKPYFVINSNINLKFSYYDINAKIRFEANNLTNTEFEVVSGYPMPLRYYKIIFSVNY
jgi:iron complex outermembrane receptor protein